MGSGGSSGGGSSSGKTDWPKELKRSNHVMLHGTRARDKFPAVDANKSMMRAILNAWDNNPYIGMTVFDPESLLNKVQDRFDTYIQTVDDIELNAIRNDAITQATTEWDNNLADTTTQESAVSEFRNKVKSQRNKDLSAFTAPFGDISEVATSQMVIGSALIFNEHERQVTEFTKQLELNNQNKRQDYVRDAINLMINSNFNITQMHGSAAGLQAEVVKLHVGSMAESKEQNNELDVDSAAWELDIYQHGANLLASVSGGTVGKSKSTTGKQGGGGGWKQAAGAIVGGTAGFIMSGGNPAGAMAGAQMGANAAG